MNDILKTTPLHAWHLAQGAKMAPFGGYEMPLWYASAKREHLAVLVAAGLFDTSHMAVLTVRGRGTLALLQRCFTKNLETCLGADKKPLGPGRCVYGAFLNDNGHVIDDAIVFQLQAEDYFVVVNAGMGATLADHLRSCRSSTDVAIDDLTDRVAKLDLQGPQSAKILSRILRNPEAVLAQMPYFSFKGSIDNLAATAEPVVTRDGTLLLLSRTGYTGEFGFELFFQPQHAMQLLECLLRAGEPHQMLVCGLAARDSLRTGAVLPLAHQDIGPWPFIDHPWEFALPFDKDKRAFTKPFIGDAALLEEQGRYFTYPYLGEDLRKLAEMETAKVLDHRGVCMGKVLTCVTDMAIDRREDAVYSIASPRKPADFSPRGLCCGFVRVTRSLGIGERVVLKDSLREIPITISADIRPDRTARRPLAEII